MCRHGNAGSGGWEDSASTAGLVFQCDNGDTWDVFMMNNSTLQAHSVTADHIVEPPAAGGLAAAEPAG